MLNDNRSKKTKLICDSHIEFECRLKCPLTEPCKFQPGDDKEIVDERMNKAAIEIDLSK